MSVPLQTREPVGWGRQLSRAWQAWRRRRNSLDELSDPEELSHIARDIGLSRSDIRVLAGKWPDSLDLLSNRLDQVKLDRAALRETDPQVLRDLQRTCALCASKRKCLHDLAGNSSPAGWEEYCPNTLTIRALLAERSNQAVPPK
jgi:uncharacterized protein YjiS (DUF1127 family)